MFYRYFGTLCGSTIFQAFLMTRGISNGVAFWSTIALGSIVNYIVLTSLNSKGDGAPLRSKKSHDPKNHCKWEIAMTHFDHGGQRENMAEISRLCMVSAHRAFFEQLFFLSRNSCR